MTDLVLEARNIVRDYPIPTPPFTEQRYMRALKGIDLKLERGKTLAIVGESGCGKSTLARILTMIDRQTEGELFIDGQPIDIAKAPATREQRRKVQMVFQNPYGSLNPRQKIGEVLGEPLKINTNLSAAERRDKAQAMLEKVGMDPVHYNRYPHMFSGGQRQRIAVARALMLNPDLLVLDEPVSALDLSVQARSSTFWPTCRTSSTSPMSSSAMTCPVVRYIADEVMVMYFGEVVEYGTRDEVFSNPQHAYTKTLFAATPRADVDSIKARLAAREAALAGQPG